MNQPHLSAPLHVTDLSIDDLEDILDIDAASFGQDVPRDYLDEIVVPWLEFDRFIGVRDPDAGGELVAAGCIFSKQLTFPGPFVHPAAGISWIGVRPGWRRRGLLRGLMKAQLHGLHDNGGEAVAILTASEAGLYGRFGYGQSINRCNFTVAHGAAFHPGVATDNVVEIRAERAPDIIKPLYATVAADRTGYLARTDVVWAMRLSDHEVLRDGASKKRWAVHSDGYVGYRIKSDWTDRGPNFAMQIDEICARTNRAFASLWRYVLDFDLTREVTYNKAWVDDPLVDLLLDPRSLTVTNMDHIWLRIVDLDRAIGLRSYSSAARVVVEVTDEFCPWNQGTWSFELNTDGGTVSRSDAVAQVRLNIRDLGACFLGGTPLARLAVAGRVTGEPAAVLELGTALATPLAPWTPEGF